VPILEGKNLTNKRSAVALSQDLKFIISYWWDFTVQRATVCAFTNPVLNCGYLEK